MTEPNRFGTPEPNRFGTPQPSGPGPTPAPPPVDPWRQANAEPPPFFTTPVTRPVPPAVVADPYAPPSADGYAPPYASQYQAAPYQAAPYQAAPYQAAQYPPPHYPPPMHPPLPYAPQYPPVGGSAYTGPAKAVRGNKGLGIAMLVLGGVMVGFFVLRALTAVSAVHKLDLYAAHGIDTRRVVTAHDALGVLGLVVFPLFIVGSLWLQRAHSNAQAINPAQVRRGIAWSWFGWVVPIAGWFVPKQIVDDAWRVTASPEAGRTTPGRRRSTALWWGLWVTFNLVSGANAHLFVSYGSPTSSATFPPTIYTGHRGISPGLEFVIAALAIAAYAAFVPIALGLSNAQEELVTRLRGSGPIIY